jgi:hypothetical protein
MHTLMVIQVIELFHPLRLIPFAALGFGQCLDINLSYSEHEDNFRPNNMNHDEDGSHHLTRDYHETNNDPLNLSGTSYAEEQELDELKKFKW